MDGRLAAAYSAAAPADPVAALQQRLDSGEATLAFDEARGYLPAVLAALKVPTASQGLVFSRTSLQVDRIAPWSPRAIYFNDDVYVGWVPDGPIIEVAGVDPKLGGVFYTLSQEKTTAPRFQRDDRTCLQCHRSAATGSVPGFIMRSVVADRHGYPVVADTAATTDATPLGKRWGGWYVTGGLGSLEHMGNQLVPALRGEMGNVQQYLARTPIVSTGGASDLSERFDTSRYLSPHSDAVALLVLAHQVTVHNLMTAVRYEALKAAALPGAGDSLAQPVRGAVERLLRAMLFVKEAAYSGTVTGSSGFEKQFQAAGPRDARGRSLRDLDLERRLFRYPLSFLVYSDAFAALPPEARHFFAERLREVLSGRDSSGDFSHLSTSDRQAIHDILAGTKPELVAE